MNSPNRVRGKWVVKDGELVAVDDRRPGLDVVVQPIGEMMTLLGKQMSQALEEIASRSFSQTLVRVPYSASAQTPTPAPAEPPVKRRYNL